MDPVPAMIENGTDDTVDLAGYKRFAIYYMPETGSSLGKIGARWLALDGEKPLVPLQVIETPRRYGFHATLKAPMTLKKSVEPKRLLRIVESFAAHRKPVDIGTLALRPLSGFLALCPRDAETSAIDELAWSCVQDLDHLREPYRPADATRRTSLSEQQKLNLLNWGYPYVGKQYRFHLSLSGPLPDAALKKAGEVFLEMAGGILKEPVIIDGLSVLGDPGEGKPFEFIARFPLLGLDPKRAMESARDGD